MENLEEVALRVYAAIFEGKKSVEVEDKRYPIRSTSNLGLRVVYSGKVRFLEQNPKKDSRWGQMAREGHKIIWVIEDGDYTAQVIDGKFHNFKE